ncbi:DNA circularization N-terminal domain-containing protein [Citrobacter braakii]|uniref:DNA circularization protein n=1 Tax=Citrobacter freundii complex TaxID=1344959 RepID=UPI002DBF53C5|nr:DNA circularization N-terminal domain-containing protein [Citrobacter braakii]MEC3924647.1 DNA circularization N-terminal domain-containing protein [Citrobacter braakii]
MSWEASLQDASFRGVGFDVINTRDSTSRVTAVYEYPYIDGGDIEDLGRKPRNLIMTTLFWGDDYETRLQSFLAALDKRGNAELIHPVFGSMPYMQCIEYQASHEAENVDYCVVEVVFLQAKPEVPFFGSDNPLSQADIIFNQVQSTLDMAQTAIDNVLAPLRTAKKWMKRIKGLATTSLNMVTVLKGELTGFVSTTTDFINYPKAYMNDLQSALSLTSLSSKSSVSNNPGSYASTSSDVTGVAGIIMADWKSGNTSLQEVAALPEQLITGQTTSAVATPSGSSVSDIAELVTATRIQIALQLATDASDILSDESVITLLSPNDVEQIAGDTRKAIQQAIDLTRELFADDTQAVSSSVSASGVTWQPVVNGLKDIALAVQELGTTVITQRPPLTTRTVEADCNLHLLAHLWYADYSRASELLRLNPTLRNPNALKAGDVLNAYSR